MEAKLSSATASASARLSPAGAAMTSSTSSSSKAKVPSPSSAKASANLNSSRTARYATKKYIGNDLFNISPTFSDRPPAPLPRSPCSVSWRRRRRERGRRRSSSSLPHPAFPAALPPRPVRWGERQSCRCTREDSSNNNSNSNNKGGC